MTKIFHVLAVAGLMLGGATTASMAAAAGDGDATQSAKTPARPGPTAAPSNNGSMSTIQTQPMTPTSVPASPAPPNDGSGTGGANGGAGSGKK
jgi:hypothetical protein